MNKQLKDLLDGLKSGRFEIIETAGDPTCQFCHSNPFRAEWKNDEWGIEAYILGKKMCVYVRGQMDSFPIAYCPQCGRKL